MRRFLLALLAFGLAGLTVPLAAPAGADAAPRPVSWARMTITSMTPRVIQSADPAVTVTGTLTNTSDRRISRVRARLQMGAELTDAGQLRKALDPNEPFDTAIGSFLPIMDTMSPGQTAPFTVTVPLSGPHSLAIGRPGVYPLLVNAQGTPDYGGQARLSAATLLLPVLSAPNGTTATAQGTPARLTVLWPLVDQQPRVVGLENGEAVLSDDGLARSLTTGGRLSGLVDAARTATEHNPELLSSMCFAIDPDLLATVTAMTTGYRVRGAGGASAAGTGGAVAGEWLAALRSLTAGHCVLPLPYADADVAALAHAGGTDLIKLALDGSAAVARSLGASPMTTVAWPADDMLDQRTMADLTAAGVTTVLADPTAVSPVAGDAPVRLSGAAPASLVPIDGLVSAALAPRTDLPDADESAVVAQDGLAALIYRAVFDPSPGRSVVVAPPRRWSPSQADAEQFLAAAGTVLAGHHAEPSPLATTVPANAGSTAAAWNYPAQQVATEVAHPIAAAAVMADGAQTDLLRAMRRDHTRLGAVEPATLIEPLRAGLLRAVSAAWRGGRTEGAQSALDDTGIAFTALTQGVGAVQPALPISLGSQDGRIPVTVSNRLPVDIDVRVALSGEPGLPATPPGSAMIPANGSITVFVPTQLNRSGRFSVYATARTPGGTALGQPARFELVSTAYGTIILIVTGTAFGLLVLLSGRRIYRRVRAAHAAAREPSGT